MVALEQSQLDALHQRLEHERTNVQSEINERQNDDVNASNAYDAEFSGYSNHMAETGTELYEQERNLALEQNLQEQLDDIDHALDKFSAGTYGICDNCGKEIGIERLEALPQATLCIDCASKKEAPGHA